MKMPDIHGRIATVEDEVAGLESMVEARTRKLWAEVMELRKEIRAKSAKEV